MQTPCSTRYAPGPPRANKNQELVLLRPSPLGVGMIVFIIHAYSLTMPVIG